jgi:nicotinamidase-related amidase
MEPIHCVEGTRGIQIIDELAPRSGEYVIQKRRYNAFLGTELDIVLKTLRIDTLIVSGVLSEVCVLFTAGEAHQRDFHVRLVEDCTAGATDESTKAAIMLIRNLTTGIPIMLNSVLEALDSFCTEEN